MEIGKKCEKCEKIDLAFLPASVRKLEMAGTAGSLPEEVLGLVLRFVAPFDVPPRKRNEERYSDDEQEAEKRVDKIEKNASKKMLQEMGPHWINALSVCTRWYRVGMQGMSSCLHTQLNDF